MPLYEYECSKCHEKFDMTRAVDERKEECTCPECGQTEKHRLLIGLGVKHSSWSKWNPIV